MPVHTTKISGVDSLATATHRAPATMDVWGKEVRIPTLRELTATVKRELEHDLESGKYRGRFDKAATFVIGAIEFDRQTSVVGYPLAGCGNASEPYALAVRGFTAKYKVTSDGKTVEKEKTGYARFGDLPSGPAAPDAIFDSYIPTASPTRADYEERYLGVVRPATDTFDRRRGSPATADGGKRAAGLQQDVQAGKVTREELLAKIAADLASQGIELRKGYPTCAGADLRGRFIQLDSSIRTEDIVDVLRHELTHAQLLPYHNALAGMFGPWGAMLAEWQADVGAGLKAGMSGQRPDGFADAMGRVGGDPIHGAPAQRIARAQVGAAMGMMMAPWAAFFGHFDV